MTLINVQFLLNGLVSGGYFALWQNELLHSGLTVSDIATIVMVQTILGVVIEIPTGVFADALGHKRATLIGYLVYLIAFGIPTFWHIPQAAVIGVILIGVASAFVNGAVQSWAADLQQESVGSLRMSGFVNRDQIARIGMIFGALLIPAVTSVCAAGTSMPWLSFLILSILVAWVGWLTNGPVSQTAMILSGLGFKS